ncbi:HAD family hydrolase [Acerihabitans arboris]|uniref:HAD-IB family hydrolase n=1 Tax=Acerihabitans arboris TaxID=2691583 RepID=A0A845SQG5_9GAMM|nr:HAD family hydrolase [Acerihabitans arboris]NDL65184.1 HAD-IB family hydrolase [Acerihabitans arboris]
MSLALFDLDETLINGDCASLWGRYMIKLGWAQNDGFAQREQALMLQYQQGTLSMEEYMSFTLQPLAGRSPRDVAQCVEAFIDEAIVPAMRQSAIGCIAEHRQRGDRNIIISASGEHLVTPIARRFGVDETLSIQLEVCDDSYTGNTRGILTYREGKVSRLLGLIEGRESMLAQASFYSDSCNDLPLLQQVGYPYAVNPDSILLRHAQLAGWPVLSW